MQPRCYDRVGNKSEHCTQKAGGCPSGMQSRINKGKDIEDKIEKNKGRDKNA